MYLACIDGILIHWNLIWKLMLTLFCAHLLGDFVFQSDRMAERKKKFIVIITHALIPAMLGYLLCGLWRLWWIPVWLLITHVLLDAIKAKLNARSLQAFLWDQVGHILVIFILAVCIAARPISPWWMQSQNFVYLKLLVIISGIAAEVWGGGIIIEKAVAPFYKQLSEKAKTSGLNNGGRWIGRMERLLIFIFFLTGYAGVIGFLVAAKSIFRFGEIKDSQHRKEAEYIIIGTLASFSYGLMVAIGTKYLLSIL